MKRNVLTAVLALTLCSISAFGEEFKLTSGWGASVASSTSPKYIVIEQGSGAELISNGSFTSTNSWVLGTGWQTNDNSGIVYTTAVLVSTNSDLTQTLATPLSEGITYRVGYTVSGITNVSMSVIMGAVTGEVVTTSTIYTPTKYTDIVSDGTSTLTFRASSTTSGTFTVSNVSVKQAPIASYAKEVILKVLPTALPVYVMYNCDGTVFTNGYAASRSIMVSSNANVLIKSDYGIRKIWYRSASGTPTLDIVGY